MNILQLREKLNDLLAAGVDPMLPVVIPITDSEDTMHLWISELTNLIVRDNETYEHDSVKMAKQLKCGSVLALGFLYNDGWQNNSFGVTRVIEPVVSNIEKLTNSIDVFAKSDEGVINVEEFYRLPNFSIGAVIAAKALGHKYVFFDTPFGSYHEIVDNGSPIPAVVSVNSKRVKLKEEEAKIEFNDLYRLADSSIATINDAKVLGHRYVYLKTSFGYFHEIIDLGHFTAGLKALDPERVIRKPFDPVKFLLEWKPEPYQSDAMSRKKIQLHCQALGMHDPVGWENGQILWALLSPVNKEV